MSFSLCAIEKQNKAASTAVRNCKVFDVRRHGPKNRQLIACVSTRAVARIEYRRRGLIEVSMNMLDPGCANSGTREYVTKSWCSSQPVSALRTPGKHFDVPDFRLCSHAARFHNGAPLNLTQLVCMSPAEHVRTTDDTITAGLFCLVECRVRGGD